MLVSCVSFGDTFSAKTMLSACDTAVFPLVDSRGTARYSAIARKIVQPEGRKAHHLHHRKVPKHCKVHYWSCNSSLVEHLSLCKAYGETRVKGFQVLKTKEQVNKVASQSLILQLSSSSIL